MATTLNFKDYFDLPMWRPESPALGASGAGMSMAFDSRNSADRFPYIYLLRSLTTFEAFNPITGDWTSLASPALAGAFGAGACAISHPSQGPRGTLAAGATTTKVILTTALPAAVGVNQLANAGTGQGFKIRIIGNSAGGSGKTEERLIIANTSGTNPTIILDSALSFTPAAGDAYEIISGRVFLVSAGLLAAGAFKYYDIATNSYSAALSIVNLPSSISIDSSGISLSELHTPYNRNPGEGFVSGGATYNLALLNCIQGTAASSTTITGSAMFTDLVANEYTNFQVRIVEDTLTPTAVGQRRRIASHTAGATGVFTVAAFAVTPSSSAKFVIENDDDKLLMRSSGTTSVYTYNVTANTWDTTTFGVAGAIGGPGVILAQSFGIARDSGSNARHSFIYCIRGAVSSAIDVLDIAGASTGVWSNTIVYGNLGQTFTTGTNGCYDNATLQGRFLHICVNGTQRMVRFDMKNRVMEPSVYLRFPQSTQVVGCKMANGLFIDGSTKVNFVYQLTNTQAQMFSLTIAR
jgi:hypothetical protein